jgi:hypothetical protein
MVHLKRKCTESIPKHQSLVTFSWRVQGSTCRANGTAPLAVVLVSSLSSTTAILTWPFWNFPLGLTDLVMCGHWVAVVCLDNLDVIFVIRPAILHAPILRVYHA